MLNFSLIQPLPVAVAVVSYMFLGFLWYTPLFGKQWLKLTGLDAKLKSEKAPNMAWCLLLSAVTGCAMAGVLSIAIESYNLTNSLEIAFILWAAFCGLNGATNHAYGNRPFALWAIEAGYPLVSLLMMATIINQMHS